MFAQNISSDFLSAGPGAGEGQYVLHVQAIADQPAALDLVRKVPSMLLSQRWSGSFRWRWQRGVRGQLRGACQCTQGNTCTNEQNNVVRRTKCQRLSEDPKKVSLFCLPSNLKFMPTCAELDLTRLDKKLGLETQTVYWQTKVFAIIQNMPVSMVTGLSPRLQSFRLPRI